MGIALTTSSLSTQILPKFGILKIQENPEAAFPETTTIGQTTTQLPRNLVDQVAEEILAAIVFHQTTPPGHVRQDRRANQRENLARYPDVSQNCLQHLVTLLKSQLN